MIARWAAVIGHGLRLASRRGAGPGKPSAAGEGRGTEFAWSVHRAQASWANNADIKASILLALEGGALYAAISALGAGGLLARPGGHAHPVANEAGMLALLLAIVAAAIAIFPRLGQNAADRGPHRQVIYFGDLRRWDETELSGRIATLTEGEELGMLSRQLTEMSKHNWVKHRWVQISLVLSLTGIGAIAVSAMAAL